MPIDLDDGTSDPEPDLAVVPGTPDDYTKHPSTALLIVEGVRHLIGDGPQEEDAVLRRGSGARVLDRQPSGPPAGGVPGTGAGHGRPLAGRRPAAGAVQRDAGAQPGDTISPVAAPTAPVAVADLFPARPPGGTFLMRIGPTQPAAHVVAEATTP
jgi:hypothetical protein